MERYGIVARAVMAALVIGLAWPASALTAWQENGQLLCTAPGHQDAVAVASDGAGGAIFAWQDVRGSQYDIYAQRVDLQGTVIWDSTGVAICTAERNQHDPQMISDGAGGAIIVWRDYRSENNEFDIYAQRVDANGNALWAPNGVPICTITNIGPDDNPFPRLCSDGVGGAIITWKDYRAISSDIYAQRVSGCTGSVMWAENGVPICTATGEQLYPEIASDGTGGAIITWQDGRGADWDVYAQHVDALGTLLWVTDGVGICTYTGHQEWPAVATNGTGGAVIAWRDHRGGSYDVFAQRLDASGLALWATNGVPVCDDAGNQEYPRIVSDGVGGAIICWRDEPHDIYAQHVDVHDGSRLWAARGVPICTAPDNQEYPEIISDGAGGAVLTWQDNRAGNVDIYAQGVDALGHSLWTTDGVAVCTAPNTQQVPKLASNGVGGAIIAWNDYRTDIDGDVYTQGVGPDGGIVAVKRGEARVPASRLLQNAPNPLSPLTQITFSVAVPSQVRLRTYDIAGRLMRTLVDAWREPGVYSEVWDGKADDGAALPSGIYFYRLEAGSFVATRKMVLLR